MFDSLGEIIPRLRDFLPASIGQGVVRRAKMLGQGRLATGALRALRPRAVGVVRCLSAKPPAPPSPAELEKMYHASEQLVTEIREGTYHTGKCGSLDHFIQAGAHDPCVVIGCLQSSRTRLTTCPTATPTSRPMWRRCPF